MVVVVRRCGPCMRRTGTPSCLCRETQSILQARAQVSFDACDQTLLLSDLARRPSLAQRTNRMSSTADQKDKAAFAPCAVQRACACSFSSLFSVGNFAGGVLGSYARITSPSPTANSYTYPSSPLGGRG